MSEGWKKYLEEHKDQYVEELVAFLRIPSVSTREESSAEVRRGAAWIANRLRQAGIEEVNIVETDGHPVVYGEWLHAPGKPTILFYGHYDVQPEDPIEEWTSPPFEPTIKEGMILMCSLSRKKNARKLLLLLKMA